MAIITVADTQSLLLPLLSSPLSHLFRQKKKDQRREGGKEGTKAVGRRHKTGLATRLSLCPMQISLLYSSLSSLFSSPLFLFLVKPFSLSPLSPLSRLAKDLGTDGLDDGRGRKGVGGQRDDVSTVIRE